MTTVTVNVASKVQPPRGAAWAARAAAALLRTIAQWSAPRAPTPISEAAQVRALARTYLNSDPAFAADLFAAADRHECTNRAR